MAKLKIELNSAGVRELLRSQGMMDICAGLAQGVQARLGKGYIVSRRTGKNRVNASIKAATRKAKTDNMKNNTILKALK